MTTSHTSHQTPAMPAYVIEFNHWAGEAFVSSQSEPHKAHRVGLDLCDHPVECDCTGFFYRGTCTHVRVTEAYREAHQVKHHR